MNLDSSSQPLTGKELLNKLKEIQHLSRREKARACGYMSDQGSGPRVNLSEFLTAVLAAKGIELEPEVREDGRGKKANYRLSVHQNGQMVIGAAYTKAMKLQPGDEFEIKLGYKHIHLKQIAEED